jgi:AmmeMemoRadiSam system protein A
MNPDVLAFLARFARARIGEELGAGPAPLDGMDAFCKRPGASFVTLRWNDGDLQGCIGSLEPRRPLVEDVAHNAIAAAFLDPRAAPLRLRDLERLRTEVSVLSPLERVAFDGTEEGARAALRVGTDGVLLACRGRRGTFLPQMWEQLETPEIFLNELKRKARLAPDFWAPDVELHRYTVSKGFA